MRRLTRERIRSKGARAMTAQALQAARRARRDALITGVLAVAAIVVNANRREWFEAQYHTPIRIGVAIVVLVLGWRLARDLGRSVTPRMFRRLDAATAGTMGFLVRLAFVLITALVVLRVLGIKPGTLAVGGAVFAVVFGLAAQQTLGHVISGLVLISAQPFRVGDRVRLQAGGVAGQIEGVVAAHGLLYTTFAQGEDSIMVPNTVVLSAAVVPIREPAGVDLRARLRPDVRPTDLQSVIDARVQTPMRGEPRIALEEVDADEVVVRVTATPDNESDGPRLADEILAAIATLAQEGHTEERQLARTRDAGERDGAGGPP